MLKRSQVLLLLMGIVLWSCTKDEPEVPNEEELITTVEYKLTPQSGGESVSFVFIDLDGDGGMAPLIINPPLASNTTYNAQLTLLNEQEDPPESISDEVAEEADDHQFFFSPSLDQVTISYNDQDNNGNPIGLSSIVQTGTAGQGTLSIILRHEPNKTAQGVSDGAIANAGGETDIEVNFVLNVQ